MECPEQETYLITSQGVVKIKEEIVDSAEDQEQSLTAVEWSGLESEIDIKNEEIQEAPPIIFVQNFISHAHKEECKAENDIDIKYKENVSESKKHLVTSPSKFQCTHCKKPFKSKLQLTKHKKSHKTKVKRKKKPSALHNSKSPLIPVYYCDHCGSQHYLLDMIRLHMKQHLPLVACFCMHCSKEFSNIVDLDLHLQNTHSLQKRKAPIFRSKTYICPKCNQVKPNYSALKKHLVVHETIKSFECDICSKKFKRQEHLKQHKVIHSTTRPFKCNVAMCEKSFKSNGELTKHMIIHSDKKPFSCSICSKEFRTSREVYLHSFVHTEDRPVKCPNSDCQKSFKTTGDLHKHQAVHTAEILVCSVCDKGFKGERSLKKHQKKHDRKTLRYDKKAAKSEGSDIHQCNDCSKIFANIFRLNRHKESVHAKSRPFLCDICHKGYKSKDEIRKHIVIHLDTRNYKCKICKFSFKRSHDLVRHNRLHDQGKINIELMFGKPKNSYKLQKLA